MAQSPAHRLGQIVGDALEAAIQEPLRAIAKEFGMYLDYKHARPVRQGKKKVTWKDSRGNTHDLDYVLEEGGSEKVQGRPRAFVETAWRRYTKHSRNKAQEIQSAILPLAETYRDCRPFLGVVLAGVFTEGSLAQFRSHDFHVAYCPYESIMRAFASEGIDVSSEEDTSEAELQRKVDAFDRLTRRRRNRIAEEVRRLHNIQFNFFFNALRLCLGRCVENVFVLTLSGDSCQFRSIEDAVRFVSEHDPSVPVSGFVRYELNIRYSNGDEVRGAFREKDRAIEFLRSFET